MKLFRLLSVLFCYLFFASGQLYSQDVLYKKDSTVVRVNIKDFDGKTLLYQIPGDSLGRIHYLSKSVLDSLNYIDGKSLSFPSVNNDLSQHFIKRNFIGIDIINIINGKKNIWYERISGNGRRSYFAELFVNSEPKEISSWRKNEAFQFLNFNSQSFFARFGINFYPFNYSLASAGNFRFSDGLSVLLGSYRRLNYNTYPWVSEHVFATTLMWNLDGSLYLSKSMQIQGGVDISLLPMLTYIIPEVAFSIGF
jgi:hypothetical protein